MGAKSILPGQEITVLYSGGYFGPNRINCQCPHVEIHGADLYVFATQTRSGKVFAENDCNSDASHEERVEEIENNIIEPPAEEQDADNESSESEISPPIPGTERTELNSESPQISFKSELENIRRKRRVTKPTFIPYRRRKKIEVFALPEVPSANVSIRHNSIPEVPLSFNSIQTYQSNLLNSVSKTVCSNGVCLTLNIKPLLSKVIEENLHILDQSKNWIPEKVLKLPSVSNDSVKTIYLIINTDGISPSKSCKYQLYPVWFQVPNLPCSIRSQYKNHILSALFGGVGKPNWDVFLHCLKNQMKQLIEEGFELTFDQRNIQVVFFCFIFLSFFIKLD